MYVAYEVFSDKHRLWIILHRLSDYYLPTVATGPSAHSLRSSADPPFSVWCGQIANELGLLDAHHWPAYDSRTLTRKGKVHYLLILCFFLTWRAPAARGQPLSSCQSRTCIQCRRQTGTQQGPIYVCTPQWASIILVRSFREPRGHSTRPVLPSHAVSYLVRLCRAKSRLSRLQVHVIVLRTASNMALGIHRPVHFWVSVTDRVVSTKLGVRTTMSPYLFPFVLQLILHNSIYYYVSPTVLGSKSRQALCILALLDLPLERCKRIFSLH
ncbi:hypothetical protein F5B20DRAFT_408436 [Whalleya microplaca]|nr:hypothetical protein F5B20DRAFT_408436 [Whalleya microplaca]